MPMRFSAVALAAILIGLPALAQTQRDAPIGAYPPGAGPGTGIGAYPPSRPTPTVRQPDGPVQRQPDAGEQILERQRAEDEKRRREEEIRRSLPNKS